MKAKLNSLKLIKKSKNLSLIPVIPNNKLNKNNINLTFNTKYLDVVKESILQLNIIKTQQRLKDLNLDFSAIPTLQNKHKFYNYWNQNLINNNNNNNIDNNIDNNKSNFYPKVSNNILHFKLISWKDYSTVLTLPNNNNLNNNKNIISYNNINPLNIKIEKNKSKLETLSSGLNSGNIGITSNKVLSNLKKLTLPYNLSIKNTNQSLIQNNIITNQTRNNLLLVNEGVPAFSLKYNIPDNIYNIVFKHQLPRLNTLLKEISKFNIRKNGVSISYKKIVYYNFNSVTSPIIKNTSKFLKAAFNTVSCLISKPVFVITPNKIILRLFIYIPFNKKNWAIKRFNFGNRYAYKLPNLIQRKYKRIRMRAKLNKGPLNLVQKNKLIKLRLKNLKNKQIKNNKIIKIISNIKNNTNNLNNTNKKLNSKKTKKTKINLNKNKKIWKKPFIFEKKYTQKLKDICGVLSSKLNKPVVLDLVRLHYPEFDNNILVSLLEKIIKKVKVRYFIRKVYSKLLTQLPIKLKFRRPNPDSNIPAFLTGLNFKIAGRLMTEKKIPRKTIKKAHRGAVATGKVNFVDIARMTNKNKRGAFSATVKSGQYIV